MTRTRFSLVLVAALLALSPPLAAQQPPAPRIGYVYPAGGRQGDEFDLTIGGKNLDGVSEAAVSGGGVQAALIGHFRPKMPATAALAELVTFHIKIAADAEPSQRAFRLQTAAGLTNPLAFFVGRQPEFREKPRGGDASGEMTVAMPSMINGRILPGEVDRFRFTARKGERLVFAAAARELVPYLPDAVPGWFQAVLALYDAKGNELAYADDFRFHPDPVLYFEVPKDGQYVIEIRDAIYRGREDFVYRIAAGELPFVTAAFPLGGKAGGPARVDVAGWNLPSDRLAPLFKEPGIHLLHVSKRDATLAARSVDLLLAPESTAQSEQLASTELISNRIPFAVDTLPECLDQEPNDAPPSAQQVAMPVIVNGRIDRPGDWDVFQFEGRAGDVVVAEVQARRLHSPVDSVLRLTDATGRQLAINDDHDDKGAGLITHQADSLLRLVLPAAGTCFLHLGDTQRKGGPEYAYRLRISPPRPDFELRLAPSSINVPAGGTVDFAVYALRKDGFSGEIALTLKGAPVGFRLGGAKVPQGQDRVRLTLTAPLTAPSEPRTVRLEGAATIGSQEVVRLAAPTDDMMQAFAYRHLVPASEMKICTAGRRASTVTVTVPAEGPVKVSPGGTARIPLGLSGGAPFDEVQGDLSDPPEGLSLQNDAPGRRSMELWLKCDAKVKPGLKGNLIILAYGARSAPPAKDGAKPNRQRAPLGMLPAIPFEVAE